MDGLVGPALVAAGLVALAGAQKILDPTMTVGALRALGWPSSPVLVRSVAAVELGLGVVAVAIRGRLPWALVALSYLAFAAFVLQALRSGTAIGSCGCFGRRDTPPHPLHIGIDLVLAGVATAVALSDMAAPLDELFDHPGPGLAVGTGAVFALALIYRAFVAPPWRASR